MTSRREGRRIYYRAAGRQVRALLESAMLAGAAGASEDTAETGEVSAAVAQERPAAARARHRPVAEH
ncbi:hypothetical protein [Streptomyces europaeiscabiei]|uniref:hypothetical protein n=1 Tax=Streptomyces europaeiscabiei TaxID=146819 RepID=UPI002E16F647